MIHIPPAAESYEKARDAFYEKNGSPALRSIRKSRSADLKQEMADGHTLSSHQVKEMKSAEGTAYMVTVNGPDFTETVVIVEASKSSQARRAAKKQLKAAGTDITNLTFSACRL